MEHDPDTGRLEKIRVCLGREAVEALDRSRQRTGQSRSGHIRAIVLEALAARGEIPKL